MNPNTRAKLIDRAIHACGRTDDLIKREETAGAIHIIGGRPRRQARGRIDYTFESSVASALSQLPSRLSKPKPRWDDK